MKRVKKGPKGPIVPYKLAKVARFEIKVATDFPWYVYENFNLAIYYPLFRKFYTNNRITQILQRIKVFSF